MTGSPAAMSVESIPNGWDTELFGAITTWMSGGTPSKGNPEFWVAVIKPGRILFEMGGDEITPEIARAAMRLAQYKLPVKTKFIQLDEQEQMAGAEAPATADAVTVES